MISTPKLASDSRIVRGFPSLTRGFMRAFPFAAEHRTDFPLPTLLSQSLVLRSRPTLEGRNALCTFKEASCSPGVWDLLLTQLYPLTNSLPLSRPWHPTPEPPLGITSGWGPSWGDVGLSSLLLRHFFGLALPVRLFFTAFSKASYSRLPSEKPHNA